MVLGILLAEKGKVPKLAAGLDCFVVASAAEMADEALRTVGRLRRGGIAADYSLKRQAVGKQLKEANRRGARFAVIVSEGGVGVKDLASGEQVDMPTEEFLADPAGHLGLR